MMGELKEECDTMVKQYAPVMMELLKSIKPELVCKTLKLCTFSKEGRYVYY